jgi:HEAT repeat protein
MFEGNPDPTIRRAAATALGATRDRRSTESLRSGFREMPSDLPLARLPGEIGLRSAILEAISAQSGPGVYETLAVGIDSQNKYVRAAAAKAFGRVEDSRSADALIAAYKQDSDADVRAAALVALGSKRDPRIHALQVDALDRHHPDAIRVAAVESVVASATPGRSETLLRTLEEDSALAVRLAALRAVRALNEVPVDAVGARVRVEDLKTAEIVNVLNEAGWNPTGDRHRVYWWLTRSDGKSLLANWNTTKAVLLGDTIEGPKERAAYAVSAFVKLGRDEIIQPLVAALEQHGTPGLAEVFLNCGHGGLAQAAEDWAARHGYSIIRRPGSGNVTWGSLRG